MSFFYGYGGSGLYDNGYTYDQAAPISDAALRREEEAKAAFHAMRAATEAKGALATVQLLNPKQHLVKKQYNGVRDVRRRPSAERDARDSPRVRDAVGLGESPS